MVKNVVLRTSHWLLDNDSKYGINGPDPNALLKLAAKLHADTFLVYFKDNDFAAWQMERTYNYIVYLKSLGFNVWLLMGKTTVTETAGTPSSVQTIIDYYKTAGIKGILFDAFANLNTKPSNIPAQHMTWLRNKQTQLLNNGLQIAYYHGDAFASDYGDPATDVNAATLSSENIIPMGWLQNNNSWKPNTFALNRFWIDYDILTGSSWGGPTGQSYAEIYTQWYLQNVIAADNLKNNAGCESLVWQIYNEADYPNVDAINGMIAASEDWLGIVPPPPVTYPCPFGDATFNTQTELDAHVLAIHAIFPNLAPMIPNGGVWGLPGGDPSGLGGGININILDSTVLTPKGFPSWRSDPYTEGDGGTPPAQRIGNYWRENLNATFNGLSGKDYFLANPLKVGDTITLRVWVRTGPSTIGKDGIVPSSVISLWDWRDSNWGQMREHNSSQLTADGKANRCDVEPAWKVQNSPESFIPMNTIATHPETNGWIQHEITGIVPSRMLNYFGTAWLEYPPFGFSPTLGAGSYIFWDSVKNIPLADNGLVWWGDAELYINSNLVQITYICPFDQQSFTDAQQAINHLNTVHYAAPPAPPLGQWIITFKPWPV